MPYARSRAPRDRAAQRVERADLEARSWTKSVEIDVTDLWFCRALAALPLGLRPDLPTALIDGVGRLSQMLREGIPVIRIGCGIALHRCPHLVGLRARELFGVDTILQPLIGVAWRHSAQHLIPIARDVPLWISCGPLPDGIRKSVRNQGSDSNRPTRCNRITNRLASTASREHAWGFRSGCRATSDHRSRASSTGCSGEPLNGNTSSRNTATECASDSTADPNRYG